jgi:hypothetical protein
MAFFNAGDTARYHGTPLGFGLLGPHLVPGVLPLPVRITHHVSPPIDLGERTAALRDATTLEALHRRVWRYCQAFLDTAVARRDTDAPLLDRLVRGGERLLQRLGV